LIIKRSADRIPFSVRSSHLTDDFFVSEAIATNEIQFSVRDLQEFVDTESGRGAVVPDLPA